MCCTGCKPLIISPKRQWTKHTACPLLISDLTEQALTQVHSQAVQVSANKSKLLKVCTLENECLQLLKQGRPEGRSSHQTWLPWIAYCLVGPAFTGNMLPPLWQNMT